MVTERVFLPERGGGAIQVVDARREPITAETVEQTAKLFSEVFGGSPWNEKGKCTGCGKYSGESLGVCASCGTGILTPAYPVPDMVSRIVRQTERARGSLYLLVDSRVVGFAWGHAERLDNIAGGGKLALRRELSKYTANGWVFTAAEVGIDVRYRGLGFGKYLLSRLLNDGSSYGLSTTVWTRSDTALAPICVKFGLTQVYGPRVVLEDGVLHETGEVLIERDSETPQRVMFVRELGGQI